MNLINNTISIVIPFFNEEKTLEQAFNNIYELKFADQIILVNDGSTDNSLKIANNLTRNNSNVDLIFCFRKFRKRKCHTGSFKASKMQCCRDL